MKFGELLEIVGEEPVFESALLHAGDVDRGHVRRQLSRWTRAERLFQLRRGVYTLAPPYRKVAAHPFVLANRILRPSYVSLQSVLSVHGIIPEHVPVTTSITTRRPGTFSTPLGEFLYRHLKVDAFRGYALDTVAGPQQAFVASPEKALLDLLYLEPGSDSQDYITALRLDNLDRLDLEELLEQAELFRSPKVLRAAVLVVENARLQAVGRRSP